VREDLPGGDWIERGLADLASGTESVASLLVSIGAPRLSRLGIVVARPWPSPEIRLYRVLELDFGDAAHSRFNALIRRLVSFERSYRCVA
jgi:hypothetical protein